MAYVFVVFGTLIAINLGIGTKLSEGYVEAAANQGMAAVETIALPQSNPRPAQ